MERFCHLGKAEAALMDQLYQSLGLSARAYHQILKVARTIADLEGAEEICEEHLLEAAFFRPTSDLVGQQAFARRPVWWDSRLCRKGEAWAGDRVNKHKHSRNRRILDEADSGTKWTDLPNFCGE
jgi:hypothetical protein